MEQIQFIYLAFLGLGIMLTFWGLFRTKRDHEPISWHDRVEGQDVTGSVKSGAVENETNLNEMKEHWDEIDKALEEFHSAANAAITELDEKYQEMLFLFSLIDDKKKEVLDICKTEPKAALKPEAAVKPRSAVDRRSSHPRRKDILNLSKQGLSVTEIAQELNVGHDMVSLILEMGKVR